jgi:hypothetical protein
MPDNRARIRTAILALLVLALAGCASGLPPRADSSRPPYIGVFTGEFVDGLPLYRLPTIEVIGSRR